MEISNKRCFFYFSHGSNCGQGALVFIRDGFEYVFKGSISDLHGRYVLVQIEIEEKSYILLNIYAPNVITEQRKFWSDIQSMLQSMENIQDSTLLLGGDFNICLNPHLEKNKRVIPLTTIKQAEMICYPCLVYMT